MERNTMVISLPFSILVGFYDNKRFEYGQLFDKKKTLVYEGEWYDNHPLNLCMICVENELNENAIHFGIEELTINDAYMSPLKQFILRWFCHLKVLKIGRNCQFVNVMKLEIRDCEKLESVTICDQSYMKEDRFDRNTIIHGDFVITNCKKACQIANR